MPAVKTESGFTENDLIAVGMLASMYSGGALDLKAGFGITTQFLDEESVGLALSMKYLMQETFMNEFGAGDNVRKIADALFEKYTNIVIDSTNKTLASQQRIMPNSPGRNFTPEMFTQLNTAHVHAVLDHMKYTYSETKDAVKALFETTSFAYNQFKTNQELIENSEAWRYNGDYDPTGTRYFISSKNFWNDFYDNGSGKDSYMGQLIGKWNGFATALENMDLKNLVFSDFTNYKSWTLVNQK
jgi:hypothetical protein